MMRFGLNFLSIRLLVLAVCFSFSFVSFAAETEQLYSVADGEVYAFSYRNWNWANAGKSMNMGAGWHPAGGEKRAYLRFELPSDVDAGHAVLKLYQNHSAGPVHELGVYRVIGPWEEGSQTYHSGQVEAKAKPGELCWMQQPAFDKSPEAVFMSASSIPASIEVDITALVRKWQAGEPNYGLLIKTTLADPTSNDPEAKSQFGTRESTDPNHRPVLVIFQAGQVSGPRRRVEARTMDTTTCEQVPGTLAVPEGQAAVNFRIERLDGGTECHTQTHPVKVHAFVIFDPGVMTVYKRERASIGLPPWPVWPPMPQIEITQKEVEFPAYHFSTSRALAVVYHYIREANKPISEFPQTLKDLVLGPGEYQLHVGQGRRGFVELSYDLVHLDDLPANIRAVSASTTDTDGCSQVQGWFYVPRGMQATKFRIRTLTGGTLCYSGVLPTDTDQFSIFNAWHKDFRHSDWRHRDALAFSFVRNKRKPAGSKDSSHPVPLSLLRLSPSLYSISVGTGRKAHVVVDYELAVSKKKNDTTGQGECPYRLSGTQTRGTGPLNPAKTESNRLTLKEGGVIVSETGEHNGYSIWSGKPWPDLHVASGRSGIGKALRSGTYTILPGLRPHQDKAAISICIKEN